MTTHSLISSAKLIDTHALTLWLAHPKALLQQWVNRRNERSAYVALLTKPNFLLKDVGITRSQVRQAIDRTQWLTLK